MVLKNKISILIAAGIFLTLAGCSASVREKISPFGYRIPAMEADWIRGGEPIEFEGGLWYPADDIEIMTDDEVYRMGDYKGVEFFVSKEDVKPYDQILTKFDRNKFRLFVREGSVKK